MSRPIAVLAELYGVGAPITNDRHSGLSFIQQFRVATCQVSRTLVHLDRLYENVGRLADEVTRLVIGRGPWQIMTGDGEHIRSHRLPWAGFPALFVGMGTYRSLHGTERVVR